MTVDVGVDQLRLTNVRNNDSDLDYVTFEEQISIFSRPNVNASPTNIFMYSSTTDAISSTNHSSKEPTRKVEI